MLTLRDWHLTNTLYIHYYTQPGEFTWPIVAMSYIYVRKNLDHIEDPQEQTLLKAFLTALYDPEYIGQCVDKFRFTTVPEEVRQIGLDGINMLQTSANATEWTFESSTTPGEGQGPFVVSSKRRSYGEYQRDSFDGDIDHLNTEITNLREELRKERAETSALKEELGAIREKLGGQADLPITQSTQASYTEQNENQISAALIMSSISMVLWALAVAMVVFRMFHRPNKDAGTKEVMNGGSGHGGAMNGGGSGHGTMNRGSGHGNSATKHSQMTQDSDMVA